MSTDPPVDMGKSSGGLHMSVYKVTEVALTNEEKAQFLEWYQVRVRRTPLVGQPSACPSAGSTILVDASRSVP